MIPKSPKKTNLKKWTQKQIQTHLYKRRRKHKRAVVVAVTVAAVVLAVMAAVADVTGAARAGAWGERRRRRHHRHGRHHCHHHRAHRHCHRHHRTPVFASTFVEVHLKVYRIFRNQENCHFSGHKRSPDMIFSAFDVKFRN